MVEFRVWHILAVMAAGFALASMFLDSAGLAWAAGFSLIAMLIVYTTDMWED